MAKSVRGPGRGLIGVARSAGVGDLVFVGHGWRDELKGVRVYVDIGDCRLDCRHVAINALASRRARAMMRVLL